MSAWYRDFLIDLAMLLESGCPLAEALESLAAEAGPSKRERLAREAIGDLARSVRAGAPLGEALQALPAPIPPEHVALVAAGESSGTLPTVLRALVESIAKHRDVLDRLRRRMTYPVVTLGVLVVVAPLSLVIRGDLGTYLALEAVVAAIVVGSIWLFRARPALRFRLPFLGETLCDQAAARALRLLAQLLRAGLSLDEALAVTASTPPLPELGAALRQARARIASATRPAAALGATLLLEGHPSARARLAAAESAGQLDRGLAEVGERLEARCERRIETLVGWAQPAVYVVVGLAVLLYGLWIINGLYGVLRDPSF